MKELTGLSLNDYHQELHANHHGVIKTAPNYIWIKAESRSLIRFPTFCDIPTNISDVRRALRASNTAVASYICEPTKQYPANTWLYICQDREYELSKLSKNARRDVRCAQRELEISPVDLGTILEHGFQAFKDTRERVGLDDGTHPDFRSRMGRFAQNRAHHFVGSWKGNKLVAFSTLVIVENWVEIEGSFSTNEDRDSCPNNGLIHYILNLFLVERGYKTVSYGLSTVQHNTNEHGLHYFKKRMHFEARPVYRAFVVHPFLHPFVNQLTLRGMGISLRLFSRSRPLRKAHGMMTTILNETRLPDME